MSWVGVGGRGRWRGAGSGKGGRRSVDWDSILLVQYNEEHNNLKRG